jgi:Spy/CpxP family protein refolding chaperone
MKKIARTALVLSLLVTGSIGGMALAQGHMGPMMHRMPGPDEGAAFMSHIADMLDLTQEQQDAAKQIHEAAYEKAKPVMEQHHAQMEEIESLLDSGKVTAQEIGTKVIAAHATRKQLEAIHEDAMTQFKALLTDEQKAKLEKMEEHHSEMKEMMHH